MASASFADPSASPSGFRRPAEQKAPFDGFRAFIEGARA